METLKAIDQLDFSSREARAKFIHNNESGIYEGKNVDGEYVMVFLQNSIGMTIKTRHTSKPRWFECVSIDSDGFQESVTYELA